jgi:hypothetical protein
MQHNYLDPVDGVIRAILREYAQADETRKAELRLRNPDIDFEKKESKEK